MRGSGSCTDRGIPSAESPPSRGRGLGEADRGLAARAFAALAEARIPVVACSKGGQRVNLCFLVADADHDRAVRTLHDGFFGAAS